MVSFKNILALLTASCVALATPIVERQTCDAKACLIALSSDGGPFAACFLKGGLFTHCIESIATTGMNIPTACAGCSGSETLNTSS